MEQALAVRVLDRLVAAADEDAFESGNVAASGDGGDNGKNETNAEQPGGQNGDAFGGSPSISLGGRAKSNRRRLSSVNPVSVREGRRQGDVFLTTERTRIRCVVQPDLHYLG